jgi:hypothetical protein
MLRRLVSGLAVGLMVSACGPSARSSSVPEIRIPPAVGRETLEGGEPEPAPVDWTRIDRNQSFSDGLVRSGRGLVVLAHPPRLVFEGSRVAQPLALSGCEGFGAIVEALGGTYAECHRDGEARFVRLERPEAPAIPLPPALAALRPGSRARPRSLVVAGESAGLVVFDGTLIHRGDGASWRSVGAGPMPTAIVRARIEPRRAVVAEGHLHLLYALPTGSAAVSLDLESGAVTDLTSQVGAASIEALAVAPDGALWLALGGARSAGASVLVELEAGAIRPVAGLPEVAGPVVAFDFSRKGEVVVLTAARGVVRLRSGGLTELTPAWPPTLQAEDLLVKDGFAWIATRDAGLFRVELERGRTEVIPLPALP